MLIVEYAVLVKIEFLDDYRYWLGDTYDYYPTEEEIESCVEKLIKDINEHKYGTAKVDHVKVEKRYRQIK